MDFDVVGWKALAGSHANPKSLLLEQLDNGKSKGGSEFENVVTVVGTVDVECATKRNSEQTRKMLCDWILEDNRRTMGHTTKPRTIKSLASLKKLFRTVNECGREDIN